MSHNIISVDSLTPDVDSTFITQQYIQYGRGETPSSPSITLNNGQSYPFYDTQPVNKIEGATLNQTGDVLDSIDLPAGKYLVYLNAGAVSAPSSNFAWGAYYFTDSPTQVNPITCIVGAIPTQFLATYSGFYVPSYITLSSATTCYVRLGQTFGSGLPYTSTNSRYALTSSLTIIKVD